MASNPTDRDLRIDLLRGACLLLIYTRHFRPNVLSDFTPSAIGFSDAAEAFVFLSGYVCGRVYFKALQCGFLACQLKALHRCWQIYVAHIFTLFLNLAILPSLFTPLDNKAAWFFHNPAEGVKHVFMLNFYPYSQSILTLYIFLLAPLPLMLWLGRKFSQLSMISLSFLIYSAVQCFPGVIELPADWLSTVAFNPFAWQFLFFAAVALGSLSGENCGSLPKGAAAACCAAAALALVFIYKFWYMPEENPWTPLPGSLPWGKADLEPLRLAHFAIVAYLCWIVVPESTTWYHGRIASAFVHCGQHSLPVFCFGVVLTNVANEWLRIDGGSLWRELAANAAGWLLMLLFGSLLHAIKAILPPPPNRKAPQFTPEQDFRSSS